jgi:hypothetical protein
MQSSPALGTFLQRLPVGTNIVLAFVTVGENERGAMHVSTVGGQNSRH